MKITSTEFEDQGTIPSRFSCEGDNTNPSLDIIGVPSEAKSLALIVDDPDAPTGTFTHWIVWNIRPDVSGIDTDDVPNGAREGLNSSEEIGYVGPCLPQGTHRYFFRLYAIDVMLDLHQGSNRAELEDAIADHVIEEAVLMGRYSKS